MIKMVIFDWKRTLYDPDKKLLIEGARDVLNLLKQKNIKLILIGKGGINMQNEVERLKVKNFFSDINFYERKKDSKMFSPYIAKVNPNAVLIIGDRINSELKIGNSLNAITVWVRQGKFAKEESLNKQEPTHTVYSLKELKKLLQTSLFL